MCKKYCIRQQWEVVIFIKDLSQGLFNIWEVCVVISVITPGKCHTNLRDINILRNVATNCMLLVIIKIPSEKSSLARIFHVSVHVYPR